MKSARNEYVAAFAPILARIKLPKWKLAQVNAKTARRCAAGLILMQIVVVAAVTWQVKRNVRRELEAARDSVERQAIVPTEKKQMRAIPAEGITLMQNNNAVRSLARFNMNLFAATGGGLVQLSPDGTVIRRFTVLDGLPESDLTALASFGSQLFIGTRSQGLVSFDGARFTSYFWKDRKAQAVMSLLEDRGRLLVGTFAGGLLEFDGKDFRERTAEQKRIAGIGQLTLAGTRLFVATFADGLLVNDAGRWAHFTIADGLPSNRVVGLVESDGRLIVATDFGVAAANTGQLLNTTPGSTKQFELLATLPALAGAVRYGDSILLCKDNGELFHLAAAPRVRGGQLAPLLWKRPATLSSCRLHVFSGEQSLWLLSDEGIRRTGRQDEGVAGRIEFNEFGGLSDVNAPSSNLISAMAFDGDGNLWAGSFRNGIDVFTQQGRRLAHVESDAVREINSLAWDAAAKQMIAGTAQGLIRFDARQGMLLPPQQLTTADGLLSNAVQQATPAQNSSSAPSANLFPDRPELMLATSRGLAFGVFGSQHGQWRALTTAHGLPSNSVYAVLPQREFIYAGTLNGLAQISGGRVVRVFNDSNSKLAQNWVTALRVAGSELFIGTYGGGVFELLPSGEIAGFTSEIGKQTVNPNAMASDGRHLYAGTLDGCWVLDLQSRKWARLKAELPGAAVMSVASDGENVYFGTISGIARISQQRLEPVKE